MSAADQASGAYRADLAHIHDDGFGMIARGAATTLLGSLQLNDLRSGLIVELACGSGISSKIFAAAGYDVIGYDIAPAMIELARKQSPGAEFAVQSLYDVELPGGAIAITAIGEALNYRFDSRAGIGRVEQLFADAYTALVPGGLLIFDLALALPAMPRMEEIAYVGDGWQVRSTSQELPGQNRLTRRIVSTRELPGGERRESEEVHELVLYEQEAIFGALKQAGFECRSLATYGGEFHFSAAHGGFIARKPNASGPRGGIRDPERGGEDG